MNTGLGGIVIYLNHCRGGSPDLKLDNNATTKCPGMSYCCTNKISTLLASQPTDLVCQVKSQFMTWDITTQQTNFTNCLFTCPRNHYTNLWPHPTASWQQCLQWAKKQLIKHTAASEQKWLQQLFKAKKLRTKSHSNFMLNAASTRKHGLPQRWCFPMWTLSTKPTVKHGWSLLLPLFNQLMWGNRQL